MRGRIALIAGLGLLVLAGLRVSMQAQRAGAFMGSSDDPGIKYATAPLNNPVVDLNRKLQDGSLRLPFEGRSGYLRAALEALQLPIDSQLLVFSRASLQGKRINEQNPRAVFFNDRVALGWVRDGEILEIAAHDQTEGIVFYTLDQRPDVSDGPLQFKRAFQCLGCHVAGDTLGVPGLLMFSTTRPEPPVRSGVPHLIDQNEALARRFGGWFVTGRTGTDAHMGNDVAALDGRSKRDLVSTEGLFEADGYRAFSSDIAAHLVFAHQSRMTNLLTRAGWEARAADPSLHPPFAAAPGEEERIVTMMSGVANDVVDYLLFVDESKLPAAVHSGSGFAERFSASGPRDKKGRSLHELDLTRRVMKYPCSYLIYSPAFDALPPRAKNPIYRRMWEILSGREREPRYRTALSLEDRQAIVEILRDTKKDLPSYFEAVVR
jgi:hypothetical protein